MLVDAQIVLKAALAEGFELAGLTRALPHEDYSRQVAWVERGMAAGMTYLTDHRAGVRQDPRLIFPEAVSMLCVGKLYNTEGPSRVEDGSGWISRYAWGTADYHDLLGQGLHRVAERVKAAVGPFAYRVAVDTAPMLERSYARDAGLGWIGKNTCLIHEPLGSWFFLGELLLPFAVTEYGQPPADRCGTCTACIEACPTAAIVDGSVDSNLCTSYWTIEAKEEAPAPLKAAFGNHLFGCDICQDVCPWNQRAPVTAEAGFQPTNACPPMEEMREDEFRAKFHKTPVARTKVGGYNRNVKVALENRSKKAL